MPEPQPHLGTGLLRSTVFRRTLGVVLLLALVAAGVIALVGWHANDILTRSTSRAIDADIAVLRSAFRERGLEGLSAAIDARTGPGSPGLYRLEDEGGKLRAGNLATMPLAFSGGRRSGTFRYQPADRPDVGFQTAAGVLIDIDAQSLLVVARDVEEQRTLLFAIYRSVGMGAALLALLGIGGGILLSRHILRRIDGMGRATSVIMSGDLSGRLPSDGSNDELDRLAAQLNRMLARIEALMAGLREVSDNIAHDLRTPLNRLRNHAEAALTDARGSEAWREGLGRAIEEADDLIKTFNALLLIARLEAGGTTEDLAPLELSEVVRDLVELYEPVVEEAGFALATALEGPLPIRANRQLIGQAVTNLIDNALKYSSATSTRGPADREIRVEARREAETAIVVVADRGPGIAPEDRGRALERFVRLERSRTLPGTGLGLSLVAAVVRLHGGTVRLEDNAPGLRVILTLPLASGGHRVASFEPRPSEQEERVSG